MRQTYKIKNHPTISVQGAGSFRNALWYVSNPVSYTHLDVYKRQVPYGAQINLNPLLNQFR